MTSRPDSSRRPVDQALLRRTRWRLIAWSAGSTLLALVVLGAAIYGFVATSLADASVAQLRLRAISLTASVQDVMTTTPDLAGGGGGAIVSDPGQPGVVIGGDVSGTIGMISIGTETIGRASGQVDQTFTTQVGGPPDFGGSLGVGALARPIGMPPDQPPPGKGLGQIDEDGLIAARAGQTVIRETSLDGTPVRVLSQPVTTGASTYIVQVVGDRTAELRTLQVLIAVLLIGSVLVLLAALAIGWLYSGRALIPIRESLRRQRDFAADASHELRTPLATVRAGLEHIRREPRRSVADVSDVLDDIEAEMTRITDLVDDLLLLARTDSGDLQLERVPVELAEVVLDASGRLATYAAARASRVELEVSPVELSGDPDRLRQLAVLLLHNALRHGPAGQVVRVGVREEGGHAVLEIDDQGPGIRREDLPRIFERFYRGADAPLGGAGLGLPIARWIVERHRGQLRAENRPGGGARFTAILPLA